MSETLPNSDGASAPEVSSSAHGSMIPEVTDLDMAFPTRYRELLPKLEEISKDNLHGRTPHSKAAEMLFFKGGKLEDYGLRVKSGVDVVKVYRYLRATLGDWGPKHEHKIGGVGHMLAQWCDVIPSNNQDQP